MKTRILLALAVLGLASVAWATDILVNTGRWEVTGEIQYGPKAPPGMPATEKFNDIHCLTSTSGSTAKAPLPLAAADCKLINYRKEGSAVKFTAKCEEGTIDYVIDASATEFTGDAVFESIDKSAKFGVRFKGKRTAASCSAAEQKAYDEK